MKMDEKRFYEIVEQIKNLKKIVSVSFRLVEDADEPGMNRTFIHIEDDNSMVVDFLLHDPYLGELDLFYFNQEAVLIELLLLKLYNQCGESGNNSLMNVFLGGASGLIDEINKARKIFPYTGKTWLNEERARLYDHVQPEYMV